MKTLPANREKGGEALEPSRPFTYTSNHASSCRGTEAITRGRGGQSASRADHHVRPSEGLHVRSSWIESLPGIQLCVRLAKSGGGGPKGEASGGPQRPAAAPAFFRSCSKNRLSVGFDNDDEKKISTGFEFGFRTKTLILRAPTNAGCAGGSK